ncbi:MAG: hypothetical protein KGZ64_10285 [Thermaerobacter sp.]|nr:hypothetical protein [Thermaerobacter sp.]
MSRWDGDSHEKPSHLFRVSWVKASCVWLRGWSIGAKYRAMLCNLARGNLL